MCYNIILTGGGDYGTDDHDHCNDDDYEGLPEYSQYDKIPPWWECVSIINMVGFCHQHIPINGNDQFNFDILLQQ